MKLEEKKKDSDKVNIFDLFDMSYVLLALAGISFFGIVIGLLVLIWIDILFGIKIIATGFILMCLFLFIANPELFD